MHISHSWSILLLLPFPYQLVEYQTLYGYITKLGLLTPIVNNTLFRGPICFPKSWFSECKLNECWKYLSRLWWCLIICEISWKIFSISKACLADGGKHWSAIIFSQDLVMRSDKTFLFINSSAQCLCFILLCFSNLFLVLCVLLQITKVPQLFSNDSWQEKFFYSGLSPSCSSFWTFYCSCNTYSYLL